MEKIKNGFFLTIGTVFILGCFYLFLQKPAPVQYQPIINNQQLVTDGAILKVGDKELSVEISDTNAMRAQGLSGRISLEENSGMLFLFEKSEVQGFWMKDMFFSIDIIWIDENWTVLSVESDARPESYPNIFYSSAPVKYVLELNAGDALRLGIDTGSKLYLTR